MCQTQLKPRHQGVGTAVKNKHQPKEEAVPVKKRSSASQREEQRQPKGEAVPVKRRTSASQREEQFQSKGSLVPVKGQHKYLLNKVAAG